MSQEINPGTEDQSSLCDRKHVINLFVKVSGVLLLRLTVASQVTLLTSSAALDGCALPLMNLALQTLLFLFRFPFTAVGCNAVALLYLQTHCGISVVERLTARFVPLRTSCSP